jgi:hypothetical protein
MRQIRIKAVVITDGSSYILHGSDSETSKEMFHKLTTGSNPLWGFDPATEIAHYVDLELTLPELED